MLRWTLRTVALCAIALITLNVAYVQRNDLVVMARLALNLAPPEAAPEVTADRDAPDGAPHSLPFDARA